MRIATGVDLLEISRMRQSIKNARFVSRVFSEMERQQYIQFGKHSSFLAGCFCAKEAFSKALGTGIRGFSLHEVSVLRDKAGKPYFHFTGRAQELVAASNLSFEVSLSNTREHAIAFVVGYTSERND